MAEHCMVIPGVWTSDDDIWNFDIDKKKMSRIVPVHPGMSLLELQANVGKEFFTFTDPPPHGVLSYWPPNTQELATGLRTPPVVLTNDGAISFFLLHLAAHRTMNLFVTFDLEPVNHQDNPILPKPQLFFTPNQPIKPNFNSTLPSSSVSAKLPTFSLFDDDELLQDMPLHPPIPSSLSEVSPECPTDQPHRTHRFSMTDETAACADEMLEQMFKEDPDTIPDCWLTDDEEDTAPEIPLPPDIRVVPSRGYDNEFWEPLIDGSLGGSDAAEVMAGIHVPKTPPETYECTTGSVFDHTVRLSGENNTDWKKDLDLLGVHQKECTPVQPRRASTRTSRYDHQDPQSRVHIPGSSKRTPRDIPSPRTPVSTHPCPSSRVHLGSSTPQTPATPPVKETRPLSEISDDEFDVPPLYDDLAYEAEDVPDLSLDDNDGEPTVGKLYASKQDCQIGLALYAIKKRFHFRQTRTTRHAFVLSCHDTHCDWRIRAQELTSCGYYTIAKANLNHICPLDLRDQYKVKATSKVIAHAYRSRYGELTNGPKAAQLQQLVLEDLRVSASYMKCHRAKEHAIDITHGKAEDSYLNLADYFERLKHTNPGTVTAIETELDDFGESQFLYAFLSFGASIQGFCRVRPVLIIDGTHLSGKYKGVLLTASGQDANFQVFPLTFAVVDGETDHTWVWFLQKVERIIADSNSLSIISDRHTSLLKAVSIVFPKAHHGACIVHIMRNVVSRYKNQGLAKLVCAAAFSFKRNDFNTNFGKIMQTNPACAKYLEDIGTSKWSRTYFQGNMYNLLTSNVAEQLNNALSKSRASPIVELFMFIQCMLTRWFSARRTKSQKHRGAVTPEVAAVMETHKRLTQGSKINNITDWSYQVKGVFGYPYTVSLDTKVCTCQVFQKLKIPCGHALLVADSVGLPHVQLVGDCFRTQSWKDTYSAAIYPEAADGEIPIPPAILSLKLQPPNTRRPSGRPKDKRSLSKRQAFTRMYT